MRTHIYMKLFSPKNNKSINEFFYIDKQLVNIFYIIGYIFSKILNKKVALLVDKKIGLFKNSASMDKFGDTSSVLKLCRC